MLDKEVSRAEQGSYFTHCSIRPCDHMLLLGNQERVEFAHDGAWPGKPLVHFPCEESFVEEVGKVQNVRQQSMPSRCRTGNPSALLLIPYPLPHSLSLAPGLETVLTEQF